MKLTKRVLGILLMLITFIAFDVYIRLYVGWVVLDGCLGFIMSTIFDILWICALTALCLGLPKKIGKVLYVVIVSFFLIWIFANYIYHCVFKQFLWMADIIMAGEGNDYLGIIFEYAPLWAIIVIFAVFVAITGVAVKFAPFGCNKKILIVSFVALFGIVVTDKIFINIAEHERKNGRWEIWQRPALIYNEYRDSKKALFTSGLYQYTAKSVAKLFKDSDVDVKTEIEFARKTLSNERTSNEMTGILRGKNVIFVLMESIDDFLINEKYTPEIKKMMDNGINFANHYTPNMGTGFTFNSEFAANTGFYCPTNSSSASIYTKNSYPQTIANRLKAKGYITSAIHFNSRHFYNRDTMYKRWGYDNYYCLMDYMPIEKCVIDSDAPKNDKVFNLIAPDGKFMTYFITYSAHLPYTGNDNKLKGTHEYYPDLVDNHENEELSNLRLLAHDTDEFFKELNKRLEEKGIAEETVIVAFTDHYAYGINDKELLKAESANYGSDVLEKTPFFIYCKGITPKNVNKVTCSVDILPTLENMFDLDKSEITVGFDAFSNLGGVVYFQDGRWLNKDVYYQPGKDYDEDFTVVNKYISDMRRINDFAVEYDYYKQK